MRRRTVTLLLAMILFAAGGWIFQVTRERPAPDYAATLGGDAHVEVRFASGTAVQAAEDAAAGYRAAGWTQLPVSTPTFRLFTRGRRTAALLAEDVPTGVRVTEFRRGSDF